MRNLTIHTLQWKNKMKKHFFIAILAIVAVSADAETRCGWVASQKVDGTMSIEDRDAAWTVIGDSGKPPVGVEYLPGFYQGVSCGCISGVTDKKAHRFVKITGGKNLEDTVCKADKSLKD